MDMDRAIERLKREKQVRFRSLLQRDPTAVTLQWEHQAVSMHLAAFRAEVTMVALFQCHLVIPLLTAAPSPSMVARHRRKWVDLCHC